jgi:hypothetical protein
VALGLQPAINGSNAAPIIIADIAILIAETCLRLSLIVISIICLPFVFRKSHFAVSPLGLMLTSECEDQMKEMSTYSVETGFLHDDLLAQQRRHSIQDSILRIAGTHTLFTWEARLRLARIRKFVRCLGV